MPALPPSARRGYRRLVTDDATLRARRLAVLDEHFRAEVDHDWDACLGTFAGEPRYEIVATG